jgi:hypothetical protein
MARSVPNPFARVPRPMLTQEEEAVQAQHRPQEPCLYCANQLRDRTTQPTEWLMERPVQGAPLAFYCTACGHYRHVPRAV